MGVEEVLQMATDEKLKRKVWKSSEIELFLKCYLGRKDEFIHSRKKRYAYGRVLDDMIALGFADTSATVRALESKMRTLFITFKNAKTTGKVPSYIAPYMEIMEATFGGIKQMDDNNSSSVGIIQSEILIDIPVDTLSPKSEESTNPFLLQQSPATLPSPPTPSQHLGSPHTQPPSPPTNPISPPTHPTLPPPSPEQPRSSRKRKTTREKYYEDKMKLKEKIAKEKLEEKRRFHNSIVETIKDIELKKLDILKQSLIS